MGIRAPRILRGRGNGQRCVDRSEAVLAVGDRRGSRVRRPRAACICRAVSSGDWHRVHRDPAPFHHPVPGGGVLHAAGEEMGLCPRVCGGYRPDIALLSESRHERVEPGGQRLLVRDVRPPGAVPHPRVFNPLLHERETGIDAETLPRRSRPGASSRSQ